MPDDFAGHIEETRLTAALSERYLAYALSTIVARSLPDVRDGLKPVHRRLLYAMQQLRLDPAAGFKKCARVVGDVMGKFHPHGDASIYEALVRLAQDFAVRYPLIEGQGNFGNIDGDNAAAMRYTESRLTDVAMALLDGIEQDAVDFRPTYDGEDAEPVVLPGAFPNLLANGAAGIAVGMATSIPPHNAAELCDAALLLIADRETPVANLLRCVKGPDFPTGGVVVEDAASLRAAYETGRGGFRLRARWVKEDLPRGTWQAVVTEIPYQVQKSRLIEQIAALLDEKKLPLLADVRDESTEAVRLVLEPRSRTVDAAVMMEALFKATQLEIRFPLNMNVLDRERTPRVMGLREVLLAWLAHRAEVLVRRSTHRLAALTRRLEVLDGYLAVFLNLDAVIRIIREEDAPKPALMAAFTLTETQAEAILNMRLRNLRRLEEMELRREHAALTAEAAELRTLLASEPLQWQAVASEIKATKKQFAGGKLGARRTEIGAAPDLPAVADDAFVEREAIVVILSAKGWIRARQAAGFDAAALSYKDGDGPGFILNCETVDRLILFGSSGRAFTLKASELPRGRGDGQPVRLLAELLQTEEVVTLFVWRPERPYLVASSAGRGFLVSSDDLLAEKRTGKQVLNLKDDERAALCIPAEGDHVAVVGDNRKLLIFPRAALPQLARGAGVLLQKYRDGGLRDAVVFRLAEGLSWRLGERTRTETALAEWIGARGQAGRLPPAGFPRSGTFGPS